MCIFVCNFFLHNLYKSYIKPPFNLSCVFSEGTVLVCNILGYPDNFHINVLQSYVLSIDPIHRENEVRKTCRLLYTKSLAHVQYSRVFTKPIVAGAVVLKR